MAVQSTTPLAIAAVLAAIGLSACGRAGDQPRLSTGVLAGGGAEAAQRLIDELARAGAPLRRAGASFASAGAAPPEVGALLVTAAQLPVAGFECRYAAAGSAGSVELALQEQVSSLSGLDGAVLALAQLRSRELLTLATAAHAEGLAIELLAQIDQVPSEGHIGVVVVASEGVARHWFSAFRIDGLPASSELPAGPRLLLAPAAEYLLCTRVGQPALVLGAGRRLAPLPDAVRERLEQAPAVVASADSGDVAVVFGKRGEGREELAEPDAMAVDSLGRLLIGDDVQRRVHVYHADGTYLQSFGGGTGLGRFGKAVGGIAVSAGGEIFCGDTANARVVVFSPDYRPLRQISGSGRGKADGQLSAPTGVAVDRRGRLFVADDVRNDVQVFDAADGRFLHRIGGPGTAAGAFASPGALLAGPAGELYVADEDNHRVQVFDGDGKLARVLGADRLGGDIEGLALDGEGRLWVVDEDAGLLRAFAADGVYLGFLGGGIGPAIGQMISPEAVAFHPVSGRLYVADELNYRVQGFRPERMHAPESAAAQAASHMLVLGRIGDPHKTIPQYTPLIEHLAAALSGPEGRWVGRVRAFATMRELVAAVRAREVDIIFESSLTAAYLLDQTQARPIASASRGGHLTYQGVLFARKGGPVHELADLRGKVVAMEDASSTSGFLVPAALLLERGIPIAELADATRAPPAGHVGYVFAQEEVTIVSWVFSGRVAAGGISTLDLSELGPDAAASFEILASSSPIAYYVVATAPRLAIEHSETLRAALLALAKAARGAEILQATRVKEFFPMDAPGIESGFAEARRLLGVVDRLLGG